MASSVWVELKFWLLVVLSLAVPLMMYLLQRRKRDAPSIFIFPFSLVLIVISGADVYLLQALAVASRATPSLLDDEIFDSALSLGLYVFPVAYGGIGLNLISAVLLAHFASIEARDLALIDKRFTPQPTTPPATLPSATRGAPAGAAWRSRRHDGLKNEICVLLERLRPDASAPDMPMDELFNPTFMRAHAGFDTIGHMLAAGGLTIASLDDGDRLAGASWNAFVRAATPFSDWDEMFDSACRHWIAAHLTADPAVGQQARARVVMGRPSGDR